MLNSYLLVHICYFESYIILFCDKVSSALKSLDLEVSIADGNVSQDFGCVALQIFGSTIGRFGGTKIPAVSNYWQPHF